MSFAFFFCFFRRRLNELCYVPDAFFILKIEVPVLIEKRKPQISRSSYPFFATYFINDSLDRGLGRYPDHHRSFIIDFIHNDFEHNFFAKLIRAMEVLFDLLVVAISPYQFKLKGWFTQKSRCDTLIKSFLSLISLNHTKMVFLTQDIGPFFFIETNICEYLWIEAGITHTLIIIFIKVLPNRLMNL